MIETIKIILSCKWCREILVKPVLLPCGETICAKHDTEFRQLKHKPAPLSCKLCNQVHLLNDTEHFFENKMAQALLDNKIEKLEFGEVFNNSTDKLNELIELTGCFYKRISDPQEFIYDYFKTKRNQVDIIRDQLIQRIQNCSESILSDFDLYERECKLNLPSLKEALFSNEVYDDSRVKNELMGWKDKMGNLFFDKELCGAIDQKYNDHKIFLNNGIKEFEDKALLGKSRKLDFELKNSNLFDVFYKNSSFNT
jgi:hypothetical protein